MSPTYWMRGPGVGPWSALRFTKAQSQRMMVLLSAPVENRDTARWQDAVRTEGQRLVDEWNKGGNAWGFFYSLDCPPDYLGEPDGDD